MEIECRTEPLDEGDRPALFARNTALGCTYPQGLEDDALEDAHHPGQQIGVICHAVTQTVADRQDPLPYWDMRQYMIHQVRRGFGHAASSARRAPAAFLAGEPDHAIHSA